jgi:hypothetical protein
MAFLGIFGKKSEAGPLGKHAERVANKRAQAYDRWDSIQALSRLRTKESVQALLPRFTFYVEPSITDQEEKDAAFTGIVESGAMALEPVCSFLRKADSISWPIKMLDQIVPPEVVVANLLDLLASMHTEYERDPERKCQILTTLAERKDPRVAAAVVRFLDDANETVRFNAVGALLSQADSGEHLDPLIDCLCRDESVRVRNRILDAFAAGNISTSPHEERVKPRLPAGYSLDKTGVPRKKA